MYDKKDKMMELEDLKNKLKAKFTRLLKKCKTNHLLEKENMKLMEKIYELEKCVICLYRNKEIISEKIKCRLQSRHEDNDELENIKIELETKKKYISQIEKDNEELSKQFKHISAELDTINIVNNENEIKINQFRKQGDCLLENIHILNEKIVQVTKENESKIEILKHKVNEDIETYEMKENYNNNRIKKLKEDRMCLEKERNNLLSTINDLKNEIVCKEIDMKRMEQKLNCYVETIEELKKVSTEKDEYISKCVLEKQKLYKIKEKDINLVQTLEEELKLVQKERENIENEKNESENKICELNNELETLQMENSELVLRLEKLEKTLKGRNSEIEFLENSSCQLNQENEKLRNLCIVTEQLIHESKNVKIKLQSRTSKRDPRIRIESCSNTKGKLKCPCFSKKEKNGSINTEQNRNELGNEEMEFYSHKNRKIVNIETCDCNSFFKDPCISHENQGSIKKETMSDPENLNKHEEQHSKKVRIETCNICSSDKESNFRDRIQPLEEQSFNSDNEKSRIFNENNRKPVTIDTCSSNLNYEDKCFNYNRKMSCKKMDELRANIEEKIRELEDLKIQKKEKCMEHAKFLKYAKELENNIKDEKNILNNMKEQSTLLSEETEFHLRKKDKLEQTLSNKKRKLENVIKDACNTQRSCETLMENVCTLKKCISKEKEKNKQLQTDLENIANENCHLKKKLLNTKLDEKVSKLQTNEDLLKTIKALREEVQKQEEELRNLNLETHSRSMDEMEQECIASDSYGKCSNSSQTRNKNIEETPFSKRSLTDVGETDLFYDKDKAECGRVNEETSRSNNKGELDEFVFYVNTKDDCTIYLYERNENKNNEEEGNMKLGKKETVIKTNDFEKQIDIQTLESLKSFNILKFMEDEEEID